MNWKIIPFLVWILFPRLNWRGALIVVDRYSVINDWLVITKEVDALNDIKLDSLNSY